MMMSGPMYRFRSRSAIFFRFVLDPNQISSVFVGFSCEPSQTAPDLDGFDAVLEPSSNISLIVKCVITQLRVSPAYYGLAQEVFLDKLRQILSVGNENLGVPTLIPAERYSRPNGSWTADP